MVDWKCNDAADTVAKLGGDLARHPQHLEAAWKESWATVQAVARFHADFAVEAGDFADFSSALGSATLFYARELVVVGFAQGT